MEAILSWWGNSGHDYDDRRLNWDVKYAFHPELCRTTMLEF